MNSKPSGMNRLRHLIEEVDEETGPDLTHGAEVQDTHVEMSSSSFFARKDDQPLPMKLTSS